MEVLMRVNYKNGHFVGTIPQPGNAAPRGFKNENYELFKRYYAQAFDHDISEKDLLDYIFTCFLNEHDLLLTEEDLKSYLKRVHTNEYRRRKRFREKIYWLQPNYYVTFTYSDAKETRESFEARLLKTFSNFKTRHGWLCAVVPEDGKKSGRLHYHCFLHIPVGGMVGELFLNTKYSTKFPGSKPKASFPIHIRYR